MVYLPQCHWVYSAWLFEWVLVEGKGLPQIPFLFELLCCVELPLRGSLASHELPLAVRNLNKINQRQTKVTRNAK